MADLTGKTAIVTGASAGIGEATALGLAAGVRVAICARRRRRLEEVATRIRSGDGEADPYPLDVTDARAVGLMVGAVAARWGRVDLLVKNWPSRLLALMSVVAPSLVDAGMRRVLR